MNATTASAIWCHNQIIISQGLKCRLQMHCQGCHQKKQQQSLIWMCRFIKFALNSQADIFKPSETAKDPKLVALKEVNVHRLANSYQGIALIIMNLLDVLRRDINWGQLAFQRPQNVYYTTITPERNSHKAAHQSSRNGKDQASSKNLCLLEKYKQRQWSRDSLLHCVPRISFQTIQSATYSDRSVTKGLAYNRNTHFFFDDDEYLIIADYYSKYPFIRKLPRGWSNSKTVVNLTKQINLQWARSSTGCEIW